MPGATPSNPSSFDGTRFSLRPDADGDTWEPDVPVCMVNWHGARAFAAWEAVRSGQPWRLPGELAWEKAARGVDGRFFPWGDGFDPSWASMRRSHRDRMLATAVGAFPVDESSYGIRDLAGSMQDWCSDTFTETGPPAASARHDVASVSAFAVQGNVEDAARQDSYRVSRSGCWVSPALFLRASHRSGYDSSGRSSLLGFRLARSYP